MSTSTNPWQGEGVSIIPKNLSELLPLVGQRQLFKLLNQFRREALDESGRESGRALAGFFTLIGGWGVGKSRVGHELCLEGLSDEVYWVVDGAQDRVLDPQEYGDVLPLFVRYVQVTNGPREAELETDTWIPIVVVEALARLVGLREDESGRFVKNQDRILHLARTRLEPKGWKKNLPELEAALDMPDPGSAARAAIDILGRMGIRHLWLVVDEIEDITDVERDGLHSDERQGIDQGLLTMIPRVIKSEEVRQPFPEVSFLLLCSLAVGDLLRQVRAIERRTGWHELTTNNFADVESFFRFLASRDQTAAAIADYPPGLKEAAFFAANRNFGWFNVIMHHAHQNHRGGKVETPELLKSFAESSTKGARGSVFDTDALGAFHLEQDNDSAEVSRAVYGLLPREVGEELDPATAARLLAKKHAGSNSHIFTRVLEVEPPAPHLVMAHMVRSGFRNLQGGTELIISGEVRFDLKVVLAGLEAYAIRLPEERRAAGHLLICEDLAEFTDQLRGLTPYGEQAEQFAPYLHGFLMAPELRSKTSAGSEREFVAPAFSFLLKFSRLNKLRQSDKGYLRDGAKNSALEEACREATKDPQKRARLILSGLANCWEGEPAACELRGDLPVPALSWVTTHEPLDLGADHRAVALFGTGASNSDVESALTKLAREPRVPVVLVLEDEDERGKELAERISRVADAIAPFVAIHHVTKTVAGQHLLRLGLMGEAYEADDLRTSHFHAVAGRAKEFLGQRLETWRTESIEARGLVVRPVFFGSRPNEDEIRAFAQGYSAMLDGKPYDLVVQMSSKVFEDEARRDAFKKLAEAKHLSPGPKYEDITRTPLLENQAGELGPVVPRVLLALLRECHPVAVRKKDLEDRFLFDVRDRKNPQVSVKARDALSQLTSLLVGLGLLHADGEKLERVSKHKLKLEVKSAQEWLDVSFDKAVQAVRAVHDADADRLYNASKDAQSRLKVASKRLQNLKLDFLDEDWAELNRFAEDGSPVFDSRLREAVTVVSTVRADVSWVHDREAERRFHYRREAVYEYDAQHGSKSYPLWKQVAVLRGFYDALDATRKKLLARMDELEADLKKRVPPMTSGDDVGQDAFPKQPLTRALDLYRQELAFDPDNPAKTIASLGTTVGINTVGHKIASQKYLDALDRLEEIRGELNDPGKLQARYFASLGTWEQLCEDLRSLQRDGEAIEAFFSDAPGEVRSDYAVDALLRSLRKLHSNLLEGGIRQGVDELELARARVDALLSRLEDDIRALSSQPEQLRQRLQAVMPRLKVSLEAMYGARHEALVAAIAAIRSVTNEDLPAWPTKLGATYGSAIKTYDDLVEGWRTEGTKFFQGVKETSFDDYVALKGKAKGDHKIDWKDKKYEPHVKALSALGLIEMRLV